MILKGYLFSVGYALVCLLLSVIIYKVGFPKKYTRKLVHILVGFEWIILYHYFGAGLHFLSVCIFFLLLLAVSYFKKLMPMISSDGDNSPGTVYYAVAMTGVAIVGCFLPQIMLPFGVGIACTSIGDGFAGVVGQLITKNNPKIYKNKSLFGSLANFVFSFASALVLSEIYLIGLTTWQCILIALLSVELEMFTGYGFDNITITWGVTALCYCLVYWQNVNNYLLPILVTPAIIAFAISKKALTSGGVALAVVLDLIISVCLGNIGFLLLINFFLGSLAVDKIKKKYKAGATEEKKDDCRDIMQVTANGFVAAVFAVFAFFTGNNLFFVGFVAAFAEAFADTVASGIGIFAKKTYNLFKAKPCDKGLSGGMSIIGTAFSLLAAFGLSSLGFMFDSFGAFEWIIAASCAFSGCIFDSFIGSVFQAKFKCQVCGKITEKHSHCQKDVVPYSGFSIIDNDIVNLISGIFTVLLSSVIYLCF